MRKRLKRLEIMILILVRKVSSQLGLQLCDEIVHYT